jgi:hypothetical protein
MHCIHAAVNNGTSLDKIVIKFYPPYISFIPCHHFSLFLSFTAGKMDLSCILKTGSNCNAKNVSVLQPTQWPPLNETSLNKSQVGQ